MMSPYDSGVFFGLICSPLVAGRLVEGTQQAELTSKLGL